MSTRAASATGQRKVVSTCRLGRATNLKYVTLYAGDDEENRDKNHKFIVQRKVATSASRTIKDMFDGTPRCHCNPNFK